MAEAKKMGKDVLCDLIQSKRYSLGDQLDGRAQFPCGPWGEYRSAFIFSTNARRFDIGGKKIFDIGAKYYFEDLGIRHALIGFRATDIN